MKLLIRMGVPLIVIALLYLLWKPPLTINLVVETSDYTSLDMRLKFDSTVIFADSVKAGTYFRRSIELKNVSNGFHDVQVESILGNAKFSKRFFVLFNRTVVLEYFKRGEKVETPFYIGRSMYGRYFPD